MLDALDIAKYFLTLADDEDPLTNLKLQKLLYYAQGFYIAVTGKPLYNDTLEKWHHGPVVPTVYHAYKSNGAGTIPRPQDFVPSIIDVNTRELLDEVYKVYGQYAAWTLRGFTHLEPPWRDAKDGCEITIESLKRYFKTRLKK